MGAQPQLQLQPEPIAWPLALRVAFRFCFAYLALYSATTQILQGLLPLPFLELPDLGGLPPVRPLVMWVAAHVFGVKTPLIYSGSGSGDKTFDWVLAFCVLVAAVAGTCVWSVLDRKRPNYASLYKWLHLFVRVAVGSEFILYGMSKVVPLQMPYPFLAKLVEPFGSFSPMGMLWSSIGASPAYEVFVGLAETVGGVLLLIPRTALLGSLICLADAIEVFVLNMTYDVPVKLFSFHLVLMTVFLLAPEMRRLAGFFFSDAGSGPSTRPRLFESAKRNRVAAIVQVVYVLLLIAANGYGEWMGWHQYGGGAEKSPLYGIWNVEEHWIDGVLRPPLLTDKERWRRVIFDRPGGVAYQRMDDTASFYTAQIDTKAETMTLSKRQPAPSPSKLTYKKAGDNQLTIEGTLEGKPVRLKLELADLSKFTLVNRGFNWIQEYPFNR